MKFSEMEKELGKNNNFCMQSGSLELTRIYCNRCNVFIGFLQNVDKLYCPRCDKEDLNLD